MEIPRSTPAASLETRSAVRIEAIRAGSLRPGSVVTVRVVAADGPDVLLALGGRRIPARALMPLAVGAELLARVEAGEQGLVLRLLGPVLDGAGEDTGLLAALRRVMGEKRPLGSLLGDLAASLRGGRGAGVASSAPAARLLQQLAGHVLQPGAGGAELLALLARAGTGYEATLLAAALRGAGKADLSRIEADLKAQLLRALSELPDGPARDAVRRSLAGLEAEQLLNVARRESGEPLHWALPYAGPDGWATAHLFVQEDGGERGADGEQDGPGTRLILGVELSRLGPVRVDIWFDAKSLRARFLCGDAECARRMALGLADIAPLLERGQRSVTMSAGVGDPEELDLSRAVTDVGVLRERGLMDVSG